MGQIGDEEFIHLDFDRAIHIEATRSGVYRIYPVCFFDKELCEKSFHLPPRDIADRVAGAVERANVVSNGVLIIASSKIVSIGEANAINERLRRLLAVPSENAIRPVVTPENSSCPCPSRKSIQ